MLLALVATAALASVGDFFPLAEGTRWTYEDDAGIQSTDEVGKPLELKKGLEAIPVRATVGGRNGGVLYYRIEGDTVQLLGYNNDNPRDPAPTLLPEAQPILRIATGRAEWQYVSEMASEMGPVLMQVKAFSKAGRKRKVLEREAETLDVQINTRIGNDRRPVEIRQDVVYAKGIGMVEMTTNTKAEGKTVKRVLKLVKFEPPQG